MPNIFVISDTHLGHKNILSFTHNSKPLRPFATLEEMHETILENWNKVVTPKDKVYHLGDVAFTERSLSLLRWMNGHKRLVRGNHDLFKTKLYSEYFEEIYGVRQINGVWLTHVPMHPQSCERNGFKKNVHGHLHANTVKITGNYWEKDDPRYFNASVERINYTPICIDEIVEGVE